MSAGDGRYRGPSREAPYALSRLSGPVSLVEIAREIEHADTLIASTTSAKLSVIAAQMRVLREAAEAVLAKADQDAQLHRAEARFKRYPGRTYHLYERGAGDRYWSLLSPADWASAPPHMFVGSYRLENDQSFTRLEEQGARAPTIEADEPIGREDSVESLIKRRLLPGALP